MASPGCERWPLVLLEHRGFGPEWKKEKTCLVYMHNVHYVVWSPHRRDASTKDTLQVYTIVHSQE